MTYYQECIAQLAAKAGFDSVQFLQTDFNYCPFSDPKHSEPAVMNYEFIATKLVGKYPCASADGEAACYCSSRHILNAHRA